MLEQLRILVVEDVASIRSLIVRLLERLGCSDIHEAADTATAWRHLERLDFDVILLDYELEKENGLKLVRRLRADQASVNRTVPVIVLTSHTNSQIILTAVQAGANSYMVKPVMPDRLGRRILDVVAASAAPRPAETGEAGDDGSKPANPDDLWILD